MTRILTCGIEAGDLLDFYTANECSVSASAHTGNYALRVTEVFPTTASSGGCHALVTPVAELNIRGWFKPLALGATAELPLIYIRLADNHYVGPRIVQEADKYRIDFKRDGVTVATGTILFGLNTWHMIEVHIIVADSGGVAQVKIDGTLDIDFSGDTKPSTSTLISHVYFAAGRYGYDVLWDDLAINDAQGGVDDSWCGDGRVIALAVDGDGANVDFSPSAGDNWECVDEVPPDGDTTYNESSDDGDYDLFDVESPAVSGVTVYRVKVLGTVRKTAPNGDRMRVLVRTGGTVYNGDDQNVLTDFGRIFHEWKLNPGTAVPWTLTDLASIQPGYENRPAP